MHGPFQALDAVYNAQNCARTVIDCNVREELVAERDRGGNLE